MKKEELEHIKRGEEMVKKAKGEGCGKVIDFKDKFIEDNCSEKICDGVNWICSKCQKDKELKQ